MKKKTFLFILALFLLAPFSTFLNAEEKHPESSSEIIPSALDFKTRKNAPRLIEFTPFGGTYRGSYLNYSFVTGGRLAFRVSDRFQVGVLFNYSRIQYDPQSNFAESGIRTRNEYISNAFMTYNIAALERPFKKIKEIDLFATVGIGDLNINNKNRVAGLIGVGMKSFTSIPWLAIRFEVNSYLYSFPRFNHSKFAGDFTSTVGPSFLF